MNDEIKCSDLRFSPSIVWEVAEEVITAQEDDDSGIHLPRL
jgi:hypothetical protein